MESTTNYTQVKSNSISTKNKFKILLVLSDIFIIAVRGGGLSLEFQSLPSFKEGVGNQFLTPSNSHRLLFPITAIIKSERAQYFYFRNRFVLFIVFMRIKTPEKRHDLDTIQSEGLFFCINEMRFDRV